MSKKVDIDLVKAVLQRNDLKVEDVSRILEDIQIELNAMQEDAEKAPAQKKQYVMVVSDPKGDLVGKEFVGWVMQIPEEDSPFMAKDKIFQSAYSYNLTPKGRRMPVKTVADVCEFVPGRVTKEQNLWIKNKEPVYLLRTDNKIPNGTEAAAPKEGE